MRSALSLRIASIVTFIFFLGHSFGMPWVGSLSPTQMAQIDAVKTVKAETMGFLRSYWDFHIGFGLYIAVNMLVQSILFWLLAGMIRNNRSAVRPIIALFLIGYIAFTLLAFLYLFWAPIVLAAVIAVCLAVALGSAMRQD